MRASILTFAPYSLYISGLEGSGFGGGVTYNRLTIVPVTRL